MREEEKKWLQKALENPKRYKIVVDNDCIDVVDDELNVYAYTFDEYGCHFVVQFMSYLGHNAEYC